jgi:hypothetical protein
MCYEDEAETTKGSMGLWHSKACWVWKFVPIVVPNMEAPLVLLKSINKFLSVFHNIFKLVAINIHPIPLLSILPPKSGQPAM